MVALLILLTLVLAFVNGANDVSKGIATLVGSGVMRYRAAVLWGTGATLAGSLVAAFFTQALVRTFSGKGLLIAPQTGHAFLMAIACGAIGWLVIATRAGLPVSTTHSLRERFAEPALRWRRSRASPGLRCCGRSVWLTGVSARVDRAI